MPFQSQRATLKLSDEVRGKLESISGLRSEPAHRVERAKMILGFAAGESISAIARSPHTNRPKVERCINKALQLGPLTALADVPRSGLPATIPVEARTWVVSLACQKPKDLGYPEELWTMRLLADHIRKHCESSGYPSLRKLAAGTVSKILSSQPVRTLNITYYLERRDLEFEQKMAQVLFIYKQVEILRAQTDQNRESLTAYVSYDEKPGIRKHSAGLAARARAPCHRRSRLRVQTTWHTNADGRFGLVLRAHP